MTTINDIKNYLIYSIENNACVDVVESDFENDTTLDDLDLDSLDTITILMDIDVKFDIDTMKLEPTLSGKTTLKELCFMINNLILLKNE